MAACLMVSETAFGVCAAPILSVCARAIAAVLTAVAIAVPASISLVVLDPDHFRLFKCSSAFAFR
jgi:hypothetical protein